MSRIYTPASEDEWFSKLIEMAFPLDSEKIDMGAAYLFKDRYLPDSIYKYRKVNDYSIKNLKEDTVWLSDTSGFNDPYDCGVTANYMLLHNDLAYIKQLIDPDISDIELDEIIKAIFTNDDPIDFLAEKMVEYTLKDLPIDFKMEQKSIMLKEMRSAMDNLAKRVSKMASENFKICSFSERRDSMLMWAHYADNHKGFCIEYDLKGISDISDPRRCFLFPVVYSENLFDATDLYYGGEDIKKNQLYLLRAALIKAIDWSYENEWRLVFLKVSDSTKTTENMGKPKALYLGSEICPNDQESLVNICIDKGVPIYKMQHHHSKFLMQPVALDEL
jgi:hypothetical protein